jgi:RecB family exonuclease
VTGILVHALAQLAASGVDAPTLAAEVDRAWAAVDAGAPWFSRRERDRVHAMVAAFRTWLSATRNELTEVAVESKVTFPMTTDDGRRVEITGRMDRLEKDSAGRPVIVDVKSGKSAVTKQDAEAHPQLAVYQLAAAYGAFAELGLVDEPGGARLLYVAKTNKRTGGATELGQLPLDPVGVEQWRATVAGAAASSVGPKYVARETPDCARCPARTSCPLQSGGRQVTQ